MKILRRLPHCLSLERYSALTPRGFRGEILPRAAALFRNIKMPKVMLRACVNKMSESCP